MASIIQRSLFSTVCFRSWTVCAWWAKQHDVCLHLGFIKCQWVGLYSGDTGCEERKLFTSSCGRPFFRQIVDAVCLCTRPADAFMRFTHNDQQEGIFLRTPRREDLHKWHLLCKNKLICSCLRLCRMSRKFHTCFCKIYIYIYVCFTGKLPSISNRSLCDNYI